MVRYKVFCNLEVTQPESKHVEFKWVTDLPLDTETAGDAVDQAMKSQLDNYLKGGHDAHIEDDQLFVDFGDCQYRFFDYDVRVIPDNAFLRKWREYNKKAKDLLLKKKGE